MHYKTTNEVWDNLQVIHEGKGKLVCSSGNLIYETLDQFERVCILSEDDYDHETTLLYHMKLLIQKKRD